MAPGTRAVTVQLQQNAGLGGLVLPGDHVDVVLTAVDEHRAERARASRQRDVLEDIRVVAIDQKMSDMSNETVMARSATLEVTPKQAEILALVTDMGKLSLTLRSIASGDEKPRTTNAKGEPIDPRSPGTMRRPISASGRITRRQSDTAPKSIWCAVAKPNHSNSQRPVSDMNRRSQHCIRTLALAFAIGLRRPTDPASLGLAGRYPDRRADTLDVSKGVIVRLDRPCSSVSSPTPISPMCSSNRRPCSTSSARGR